MKTMKLISILLAVLMLMGTFAIVAGAESTENDGPQYSTLTGNGKSLMAPDTKNEGYYLYKEGKYIGTDGKTYVIETAEEKIALMDYRYGTDKYELYVDAYSGEVAIRSKESGEILFTNPYTIGQSTATASDNGTKEELLSQIIVNYTKITDETKGSLYSYTWAALRNQINVKNIKGGIRVEYTIGREENRSLLPRLIEASAMEEIFTTIETNMEEAIASGAVPESQIEDERHRLFQFKAYYHKYSLNDAYDANGVLMQDVYTQLIEDYPILEKYEKLAETDPQYADFAVYALQENMGERVIKTQEGLIKEYHKEYTFEMMEAAHAFVEYEAETETYPLFKMALEYTVEDSGLVVRLPANGIRFDETLYRLDSIDILPYMGAGKNPNAGYTFFPDGSGTLFDFQDIAITGKREKVTGKVYGQDYAYHKISGMYEEVIRYPVFGIYEEETLTRDVVKDGVTTTETYTKDRGFVAIIEQGDSLMELSTYHGGVSSEYNTIIMSVLPRPTDSYNMADALSVGGTNKDWTVVCDRKYTGSYTVRYVMLTDDDTAAEKGLSGYYETSYVGMAKAYRDYLIGKGMLTKLTAEDVEENIPLYIETFGALETTERFLSIPIQVMTPLTSFGDIKTMYEGLKNSGITNVNFVMTGYTDGGMTGEKVPYNLKWESAVKKEMDFDELTQYAKDEGFGLFPNFDFVFSSQNTLFDGLTLDKHAAKTIDDRYTSKREYSATKHTYISYYELALSAAYYDHFYQKFIPKYNKYSPIGISVGTLGSYLNSDFDEDEPYNRADSQEYTVEAFKYIDENLPDTELLTSGGNAYCWKYVDHITDIALDSSRFSASSAAVPFLGIVLHGFVEIAGTPVNMEGNIEYAFLKAIESGASLKFILSYRNTEKLKEYETLSKYYSVNYSIWFNNGNGDLVSMYKELNELLKDVQTSAITGHKFLDGTRVPDDDELKLDADQAVRDAIEYEEALKNANSDAERRAIFEARQLIIKGTKLLKEAIDPAYADGLANQIDALRSIYNGTDGEYKQLLDRANRALLEYRALQQYHAIHTDIFEANSKALTTYDVASAISAYEKYQAADPSAANYAELKKAYEDYEAIIGAEYINAVLAENAAKAALDADANNETLKSAYDNAVAYRESLVAGAVKLADVDVIIDAMDQLEPHKQELLAAYGNSDKTVFEAELAEFKAQVDAIYGPLVLTGLVYKINYNGKTVGGSGYYRDHAGEVYKEITADLDECYAELCERSAKAMDEAEQFRTYYNVEAFDKALETLEGVFSDEEYNALKAEVDAVKAIVEGSGAAAYNSIMTYDINGKVTDAYAKYQELYAATDKAGTALHKDEPLDDYEISGMKASTYLKATAYSWTSKIKSESKTEIAKPVPNTEKYVSDANKIVYETFDNGTEFLLNFNDYRVVVELNGVSYTIDAYGYIVLKRANV